MQIRSFAIAIAVAAAGISVTAPAFAQAPDYAAPWRGGFWGYLGASAGESKFRTECDRTATLFECDRKDTGWKVYAGGKFSQFVGLEVGYTDFGTIRSGTGETEAWAVPVSVVVGAPIGPRFAAFGKVGGLYSRTNITRGADLNDTFSADADRNGWGWTYGAGATFAITPAVELRADFDRYKLDFAGGRRDVDMLSAGVQVRF